MDNTICDFCKDAINEQSRELAIYFERKCQAIRDSAMSGCRVCGILKADLDLVENPAEGPEAKASVFFTYVEPFLDPENDPWGLMLGLNNTPLRYLLWEPEQVEPLMVEDSETHLDTSSVACFDQARAWLQTCDQVSAARNITFQKCTFNQLGAGGIGIGNDANAHISKVGLGASNISIIDGYFTQVMGGSILAGGIQADAHHPSDPRMVNSRITISGNIFYNNSALFSSTVNILATYVQNSEISHNDIYHATYSGISHGYGWGTNDAGGNSQYVSRGLYKYQPVYDTPTTSQDNLIKGNLIHSYGLTHTDLGALYSLSCSPGTLYINNYGYDSEYKGLHPDEGSSNLTYINNILLNNGLWYDPNDKDDTMRTGNNTLVGNWGKVPNPKYPLDGYPNHTGAHHNTFLRNKIVQYINETSAVAQKAAYRSGVLPGARGNRPVSNDPSLADAFLLIGSGEGDTVVLNITNFDDIEYQDVAVKVSAEGRFLRAIEVPVTVPADGCAIATYQFSGTSPTNVTATVTYRNPRTGWKRTIESTEST